MDFSGLCSSRASWNGDSSRSVNPRGFDRRAVSVALIFLLTPLLYPHARSLPFYHFLHIVYSSLPRYLTCHLGRQLVTSSPESLFQTPLVLFYTRGLGAVEHA